jgi:hypothetical protein
VHTLLGARIGPVIPRSLHITGTAGEWESWTQMRFPEAMTTSSRLAYTVHIDRERDRGGTGTQHLAHPRASPGDMKAVIAARCGRSELWLCAWIRPDAGWELPGLAHALD